MKIELTAERWRLSVAVLFGIDETADDSEETETVEPVAAEGPAAVHVPPMGSTCGDVERAPPWDHDERPRIGFRADPRQAR